jgi:hypothetical protein
MPYIFAMSKKPPFNSIPELTADSFLALKLYASFTSRPS